MADLSFVSPGAAGVNALQEFLVKRAALQRQAMLDSLNQQAQAEQQARARAEFGLQQQEQTRLSQQAATEAEQAKTNAANAEDQRQFARATTIAENAVPGVTDQGTSDLLTKYGYGNIVKKVPGIVSQGAQTGTDVNGVPQYDVSQTPDTFQMAGGEKYQSARITAQEKAAEAAANQAAEDRRAKEANDIKLEIAKAGANKGDEGIVAVQTVDDQGRPVTKYMRKSDALLQGSFDKPQGQTVQNRVESAKAVVQTAKDITDKLQDPNYAKNLGVTMGRYNSVRDFIGNPPPEYADLAGNIESFALANMGVHGMRSTQGAEMIKNLLDQKHTPEALAAAINGLTNFSNHFIENTSGKPAVATASGDAAARAKALIDKYAR